jgi:hypothetical protein
MFFQECFPEGGLIFAKLLQNIPDGIALKEILSILMGLKDFWRCPNVCFDLDLVH